jgi:predicted RNA polymerase sigma factor
VERSGALAGSHLLPGVRAELLARLGRTAAAADEYRRAAELCANVAERSVLLAKAAALTE